MIREYILWVRQRPDPTKIDTMAGWEIWRTAHAVWKANKPRRRK